MSEDSLNYSIRWIFNDDNQHQINAKTLIKSEQSLVDYLYSVANEFNLDIHIEILARSEGSFVVDYVIPFILEHSEEIFSIVLKAALAKFFSPNPKANRLEEDKYLVDIQEKVNSGTLTQTQAEVYIENAHLSKKQKNTFFKANKADNSVKQLEIRLPSSEIAHIPSKSFDEYIYTSENENTITSNARIYIISPVIVAGSNELWSGEYEKEKIRFYIKDKEFLERAQNKDISFNTGFYIDCELKKIVKDDDGKEKIQWEVIEVNKYATDQNHEFIFYHKKKVNRVASTQMSLEDYLGGK